MEENPYDLWALFFSMSVCLCFSFLFLFLFFRLRKKLRLKRLRASHSLKVKSANWREVLVCLDIDGRSFLQGKNFCQGEQPRIYVLNGGILWRGLIRYLWLVSVCLVLHFENLYWCLLVVDQWVVREYLFLWYALMKVLLYEQDFQFLNFEKPIFYVKYTN